MLKIPCFRFTFKHSKINTGMLKYGYDSDVRKVLDTIISENEKILRGHTLCDN